MSRRVAGALPVVALVALVAAGCSSGSSTATTRPTTPTSRPSTTTSAGASTPSAASSTSNPSTAPAGPSRCPTPGLSGALTGMTGAAGTFEVTVALTSHAPATCALTGYPGLQLLGSGGAGLPTNVVRGGNYPFTAMAPTTVTLATGQSADFNIGYSDVPVGGETSCPTSSSLEITPPDATDHLVVAATLHACGGGTLVVSPVFAAGGTGSQSTAPPSG